MIYKDCYTHSFELLVPVHIVNCSVLPQRKDINLDIKSQAAKCAIQKIHQFPCHNRISTISVTFTDEFFIPLQKKSTMCHLTLWTNAVL
jgi:hypothetical protein